LTYTVHPTDHISKILSINNDFSSTKRVSTP
jgi:hypothetical protein